jgi:hypothetical protein
MPASGHHGLQQRHQVQRVALHRRRVVQRGRVLDHAADAVAGLAQVQRQVELGKVVLQRQRLQLQAGQGQRAGSVVVPREHGLEQRAVRQAARRLQQVHHLLERQVLVVLRGQRLGLDPLQQPGRVRLAGQVDAQRQRVDEEADQTLGLHPRAVGHRRADHEVVLAGQARQQGRPRGQQRHVQRGAMALAQRLQRPAERRVQFHGHGGAPRVKAGRPGPVGRQLQQRGRAGQAVLPVGRLALQFLALQPLPLPGRIVRVLDRRHRQRVVPPLREGLVQHLQLARQHPHGPAVRHDVMHRQQQHMLLVLQHDEAAADQRPLRQVERGQRLRRRQCPDLRGQRGRVALAAQVVLLQREAGLGRRDALHRLAILQHEARAQGLVARHDACQRPLQCAALQPPGQAQPQRYVVGGAGPFQLRQEPQALLRERQRQRPVAGHRGHRRRFRRRRAIPQRRAPPRRRLLQQGQQAPAFFSRQWVQQGRGHPNSR